MLEGNRCTQDIEAFAIGFFARLVNEFIDASKSPAAAGPSAKRALKYCEMDGKRGIDGRRAGRRNRAILIPDVGAHQA